MQGLHDQLNAPSTGGLHSRQVSKDNQKHQACHAYALKPGRYKT